MDSPTDWDIWGRKGALISVSPPEYHHAFILACAADLEKYDCTEDVKAAWRRALLSVPVQVTVLGNDSEKYARATSEREKVADIYEGVYWTAFQRIFVINRFRLKYEATHGKCSAKNIASAYNELNIRMAKQSEAVAENMVDSAGLSGNKRGMRVPSVLALETNGMPHQEQHNVDARYRNADGCDMFDLRMPNTHLQKR